MESALNRYIRRHSTLPSEALLWIEKQTNIRTNYPRMLSGPVQGELLKMASEGLHGVAEMQGYQV